MDIDSDSCNLNSKTVEERQMDDQESSNIRFALSSYLKSKEKEKEDLSKSMGKLQIDESSSSQFKRKPIIIIVIGMARSGKTSFLHRLVCHTEASNIRGYVINLDLAIMTLHFGANIDIRDNVQYKEVMKQFNLARNGGILTSPTKFDEVISVIEKRADQLDYVLVDTPGQIEIFTWSASGAIIAEAFVSTLVIAYVVDTPRSASPLTFMSNMLYACSIFYKIRYHIPRSWLQVSDNLLVVFEETGGNPLEISIKSHSTRLICAQVSESHYPPLSIWSHPDIIARKIATDDVAPEMHLQCDNGLVISIVTFASYGTPEGNCQSFSKGNCHARSSLSVVSEACQGRNSCSVNVSNAAFGADPCRGIVKTLAVEAECILSSNINAAWL